MKKSNNSEVYIQCIGLSGDCCQYISSCKYNEIFVFFVTLKIKLINLYKLFSMLIDTDIDKKNY